MKRLLPTATFAASLLCGTAMAATGSCTFNNGIQHVVYLQFDNTHLLRDNPNVPSDIEQMPTLLNFLKSNGVVLSNDHTQLISHTADGLLTSMTGVYPDRHGAGAIANSFNYYNSVTNVANHSSSSFVYWTNQLTGDTSPGGDTSYILQNELGQNAPAPWVAYTRAGCDVGAAGIADIDLENNNTDLATTYGNTSPEYTLGSKHSYIGIPYFEGVAIHCAQNSAVCAKANTLTTTLADGLPTGKAVSDVLPQEPNGYTGFQAIFGARYAQSTLNALLGVNPTGNPTGTNNPYDMYDYQGNLIGYQTAVSGAIVQADTDSGFPGFSGMFPWVTLKYTAAMLEAGVPVVYGYISDAHDHQYGIDDYGVGGSTTHDANQTFAYGPGEAGYVAKLKQYDAAWASFFADLNAHGINKSNTLFVILVEEGDAFAGGAPTPSNCNGISIPCTYPANAYTNGALTKGEVEIDLDQLLAAQFSNTTPFNVHTDQAPAIYLNGSAAGQLSQTSPTTRSFEQDLLKLKFQDPYFNNATFPVVNLAADQAELAALHMVTSDPLRTPSFVAFNRPDVYAGIGATSTGTGSSCPTGSTSPICTNNGFAWNHGGVAEVVERTWSGMVGPGVNNNKVDNLTWADHVDVRPTMFALLGLQDDYAHDGRVLVENLNPAAIPSVISANLAAYKQLAAVYKQLNAPFGAASKASLIYATKAIKSHAKNDATYTSYISYMNAWVASRNALVAQIKPVLNNAEANTSFDPGVVPGFVSQANALIAQMQQLASEQP